MMTVRSRQPLMIIDDSDDDYEVTRRALKKCDLVDEGIVRFDNGPDAMKYLHHEVPYDNPVTSPLPAVILLDLNMPGMDGREVLTALKSNEKLRGIPVLVMTTSDNERDIAQCYAAGANTFVVKPVMMSDYNAVIQKLKEFWLDTAKLPKHGSVS